MALRVHNSDISVPGRRYKQIQDLPILRRDLLRTASVPHRAVAVLTMPQSGETVSPQMTLVGMALPPRYREITIRVFFTFFRFPKIFLRTCDIALRKTLTMAPRYRGGRPTLSQGLDREVRTAVQG
jgi:hypothetical protein